MKKTLLALIACSFISLMGMEINKQVYPPVIPSLIPTNPTASSSCMYAAKALYKIWCCCLPVDTSEDDPRSTDSGCR